MKEGLKTSLAKNKADLRALFGETIDLYTKEIEICGFPCCICMFEGLSSIERLWIMMLDALSKPREQPATPEELFSFMLERTAIPLESKVLEDMESVREQITAGTSIIFVDGVAKALVLSTQSMQFRSVSEPSGEGNVRGSREGFTELLRVNISLLRRLVRTGDLMAETMNLNVKVI